MPAPHPRMHGLTHVKGGPDPIPGLCEHCMPAPPGGSYEEIVLAEPTLVGYWPLNEAAGSNAFDLSIYGNDFVNPGDFHQTPTQGVAGPFPSDPTQTSYDFTGTGSGYSGSSLSDYLAGTRLPLYGTGAVTFECWLYPTARPSITGIVAQANNAGYFQVQHRSSGVMSWDVAGTGQILSTLTINLSQWTHYVGTASVADGMKMYWNGALVASGTCPTMPGGSGGLVPFYLGSAPDGSSFWNPYAGRIAQVAVYDAVLDAATISAHHSGGVLSGSGGPAGSQVLINDGSGGATWGQAAPAAITPGSDGQVLTTVSGAAAWAAPAGGFDPATATEWWFPLVDSDGTCVLDDSGNLIPTLIPL